MTLKTTLMGAVAGAALLGSSLAATAEEITVAYFLEWPMPFQYGKAKGIYEEEMGVDINWVAFDTGTAMSAAMASGDVDISVSQGVPPFVVATSAGQDLQIVDVAVSYSENDNCVVAEALEIDKDTAGELAGKQVAVPIGTAAHYGFLRQMDHFGIDVGTMDIVDMAPADSAAAFAQGNLDMVCGWGAALRRMKDHGNVLLPGAEKEALGILEFDETSAPARFAAENSYVVHYSALLEGQPSRYAFQCLEPTTLVALPYTVVQNGYEAFPDLERLGRRIAEQVLIAQQRRIEQFQFGSAEERYLAFVKDHPQLFNRVSLTHLSSYLGIQRPSLSRIRQRLAR